MNIKRAFPVIAAGALALLCLPAPAQAGAAMVDDLASTSRIPQSAQASFAAEDSQFQYWLAAGGAWSGEPLAADAPHRILSTASHKQLRNDYCGPATMAVLDHFLRGAGNHWGQGKWAAYVYDGYRLWTDANGASMWVMAMGLRDVVGRRYTYTSGNTAAQVCDRTEYAINMKSRPVAYGTRIYANSWPNYRLDHRGHIMCGRGFDWRVDRIYVDDPYPEDAPPPLGHGSEGGDTYGQKVYKKGVVAGGVVASDSKQVVY